MAQVWYLTHPQVAIDPDVPVPDWGLSDLGRARMAAFVARGALPGVGRVISSAERKAVEAAAMFAAPRGLVVQERPAMHENDRSSTGYLPGLAFEAMADAFFAEPDVEVRGWESARAAQARIVAEVAACLAEPGAGDVLIVGHGAVGALLRCHLGGWAISRSHDQPGGGGNAYAFDRDSGRLLTGWVAMETLL